MTWEAEMKTEIERHVDFSKVIREDGTIMDVRAFVRALSETGLYWVVAAHGLEWNYVLCRIADEFVGLDRPDPDPLVFLAGLCRDFPEYGRFYMPKPPDVHFFLRSKVPVEVIAMRLGLGVKVVRDAKVVLMRETEEMKRPELPAPTLGVAMYSTALH